MTGFKACHTVARHVLTLIDHLLLIDQCGGYCPWRRPLEKACFGLRSKIRRGIHMKVLLDTNIVIHRETRIPVHKGIGHLFRWIDNLNYKK
jgi:hypothetical protein